MDDVHTAERLFPQPGQADLHANWGGITSGLVDVLLGINAANLHPREEKLHSGIKLLHSCM